MKVGFNLRSQRVEGPPHRHEVVEEGTDDEVHERTLILRDVVPECVFSVFSMFSVFRLSPVRIDGIPIYIHISV